MPELSHLRQDSATPTLMKNYEGELGKVGAMEVHRTDHPSHVIVYHWAPPQQLRLHCDKQPRQSHGHVGEEPTTSTSATSPTSLTPIIVATEATTRTDAIHKSRMTMSSSKDEAP